MTRQGANKRKANEPFEGANYENSNDKNTQDALNLLKSFERAYAGKERAKKLLGEYLTCQAKLESPDVPPLTGSDIRNNIEGENNDEAINEAAAKLATEYLVKKEREAIESRANEIFAALRKIASTATNELSQINRYMNGVSYASRRKRKNLGASDEGTGEADEEERNEDAGDDGETQPTKTEDFLSLT